MNKQNFSHSDIKGKLRRTGEELKCNIIMLKLASEST
jgi:hypothetical protein